MTRAFAVCTPLCLVVATWAGFSRPSQASGVQSEPDRYDCAHLDNGIVWYGPGNQVQKAEAGTVNTFWDPRKPTLVYAHGWQPDTVSQGEREGLHVFDPDTLAMVDLADPWLQAGWNVGVFHWTGLADELDHRDAEVKIWSPFGETGMRWRTCDGDFRMEGAPKVDVGKLFYDSYVEAMRGYQGSEVRILGHSLGSQLAVRLTHLVASGIDTAALPANLMPTRVALLDPWWTSAFDSKVSPTPAQQNTAMTRSLLARGVLFEMYKSSDILATAGDENEELTQLIGQSRWEPEFIPNPLGLGEGYRHTAAPQLYLTALMAPPPHLCGSEDVVQSASMSNDQLRRLLQAPQRSIQSEGRLTTTAKDDCFVLEARD